MTGPSPAKCSSAVNHLVPRLSCQSADLLPATYRHTPTNAASVAPNHYNQHLHLANGLYAKACHPLVEVSSESIVARRTVTRFGMTMEFAEYRAPGTFECRYQAPVHLLIIYEQGSRRSGMTSVGGLPESALRSFSRKLTLVPAGYEYRERHEARGNISLTYLYIDPLRLPILTGSTSPGNLSPQLFFEDPTVWQTATKLKSLFNDHSTSDQLCIAAFALFIHDIGKLGGGRKCHQLYRRGGLAAWQQRNVTTFIESHLAENISLATLAELVGLSQSHFCRAFKRSVGKPPHRYQMERRIECAKALLANRSVSVTEIALQLGFSDSSSFASAFRKITGTTPTHFARSL
jgi:AraC family transcriptional regulator